MEENTTTEVLATQSGRTLNTYLGLREKTEKTAKNCMADMLKKFTNKQGLFQGERKTFNAAEGYLDDNSKRGYRPIRSTVAEQMLWLQESIADFMTIVFTVEKTNASGNVRSNLIVEGDNWGSYTSLELLRLKTTLENPKLKGIYANMPTRDTTKIWKVSDDSDYVGKPGIFQTPTNSGSTKTTIKETYVVYDPHAKDNPKREPVVAEKSTQVITGNYTVQNFSGEFSEMQCALLAVKYDNLHTAVIEALQRANNVAVVKSDLGIKVFNYLHADFT